MNNVGDVEDRVMGAKLICIGKHNSSIMCHKQQFHRNLLSSEMRCFTIITLQERINVGGIFDRSTSETNGLRIFNEVYGTKLAMKVYGRNFN